MSLKQLLIILLARYRVVLFVSFACLALALAFIRYMPEQYTASASLLVDLRPQDPISAMLAAGNRATQEDIIKSDRVAQNAVKLLGLADKADLRKEWQQASDGTSAFALWLADRLQRGLSVAPPRRDSTILVIEYTGNDPAFAAAAANAFAQAYVETTLELRVEPSRQNARWVADQTKAARDNLEKAQTLLSEYQQAKSIIVTDERVDLETSRLFELNTQLAAVQAQMADARSKQRAGSDVPEITQNTVVQGLRADIARQEARMKLATENLGTNHPEYRSMESELAELRARLAQETKLLATGFSTSHMISTDKEKELRAAIEAQKKRVLELRTERDQLAVLQRDVESARAGYDAVARRHTMTNLESQATQANISLLTAATPPLHPNRRADRYILLAVLLSGMLGLGAGVGLEILDRRVRTVDDVAGMLQLPVLAVIGRPKSLLQLGWRRQSTSVALR